MIEIRLILAKVLRFVGGLFKEQKEEEVKGSDRIKEVLGHFQEDIENLSVGIVEIHHEDEELGVQIQELEEQHNGLQESRVQAQKLLEGLKALLGA